MAIVSAKHLAALTLMLLVAGSCSSEGEQGQDELSPSWSPDGSRMAFAADGDIYVVNANGRERVNLTDSLDDDTQPAWSPSGDVIAFMSRSQLGSDIHVVRRDGTGQTNLTNHPAVYHGFAWSPDGTRIAFASHRGKLPPGLTDGSRTPSPRSILASLRGPPELYVVDADGTNETRLTFNEASDFNPTWSPDGTRLAFQSDLDGDQEIYVIGVDGKGLTQLTDNARGDVFPAWSPDGRHIAFASNRPEIEFAARLNVDYDIYVMNPDGTEQINLNNAPQFNFTRPSWSPDSSHIAFDGRYSSPVGQGRLARRGNNEIFIMRVDGPYPEVSPVTNNKTNDPDLYLGPVVWSPNSESIAFTSRRSGSRRLSVVRLKDSDSER